VTYSIHLVTGEKGGVGKSLTSQSLIAYHFATQQPFIVVECDRSNGDVGEACSGKHNVFHARFTNNPDQLSTADIVLEAVLGQQSHAIVNLPAQSTEGLKAWLETGSLDAAAMSDVRFVIWIVTNGEKDSIGLFYKAVEAFGSVIPHILVRNTYFTEKLKYDFSDPERNDSLAEVLTRLSVPIVTLPRFTPTDLDIIRTHQLTLTEAVESSLLGVVSRSRVYRSLKEFFAQLNTLEVFSDDLTKKRTGTRKRNQKTG
jgi:hypothetical protein